MLLSDEDIATLTRRKRPSAQCRVLLTLGIECRRRPDGSLVVLEDHVRRVLGESVVSKSKAPRKDVFCFDNVR